MELIKKLISKLPHLFIAVIIRNRECVIKYRLIKDNNIALEYKINFDLFSKEQLSLEAVNFLNSLQEKYKLSYIAYYLNLPNQGAIAGCEREDFKKLNIKYNDVYKLFVDNRWSLYTSSKNINFIRNYFKDVGIDFIFSPFALIEYFIKREIKDGGMQLFLLYDKGSVALSVYYGKKFLYSNFYREELEDDENVDLEAENKNIFEFLQYSISNFYEGNFFESSFIERVVIFDNYGIEFALVTQIENELFLPVDIKEVSIENAMIDLSKAEI